jgi:hypothetical protein
MWKMAAANRAACLLVADSVAKLQKWLGAIFREKSNQATIADRCVLKRATEVAGEFIASCCGPPHDYSIAAPTAQKICLQRSKKSFATLSARNGHSDSVAQFPLLGAKRKTFARRRETGKE